MTTEGLEHAAWSPCTHFSNTNINSRTGIAKVVGSGGGAVGGGLTLVGGLLTIMSAGAALPVLLVGTGIGLASGVAGGAAAITEKIIKVQSNPLNGSPDNGSIWLLVRVLVSPIFLLHS